MNVLMFGWEFPPHISGGLGTACFGLTQALSKTNTNILFVVPKADDHSPFEGVQIVSASNVPIDPSVSTRYFSIESGKADRTVMKKAKNGKITSILVKTSLLPYFEGDSLFEEASLEKWNYQLSKKAGGVSLSGSSTHKTKKNYSFTGGYGSRLLQEVERYATVAGEMAREHTFDVIHAHDWLTYPAGIEAKKVSGKPLVIHVHATEFDRAGEQVNNKIYQLEKTGMEQADRIIAVSQFTKNIIVSRYQIPRNKVVVVHNGVLPKKKKVNGKILGVGRRVVTFLGRITQQKGPGYFIDAAKMVLQKFPNVHFVMAGSGDLLPKMIEQVAALKLSSHIHFTGFLNNGRVDQIWSMTDVYVMPSVSEPFGITPLEAIMAGVPVIISNQSGVAEVVDHAIKIDFWDTEALANAICNLLTHKSLINTIRQKSEIEIKKNTWDRAAKKINIIYHELTTHI